MTKGVTIYGIKNCDTMKKARAWLDAHRVAYDFHDYKTAGIEPSMLAGWAREVGWETLLNRAGTTFRKLPEKDKAESIREEGACPHGGAALDDQAPRARGRRRPARRLQAGHVREGARTDCEALTPPHIVLTWATSWSSALPQPSWKPMSTCFLVFASVPWIAMAT